MSSEPATPNLRPPYRPLPSYWECNKCLRWLKRFQGLLIHRDNWGLYAQDAPPLDRLLPGVAEKDKYRAIEREINKLVPLVSSVLDAVEISAAVTHSQYEHDLAQPGLPLKEVKRTYDLIDEYFELPRGEQSQEFFTMIMHTLDRAVGGFEEYRRMSVRRMCNPIWLTAAVVSIPIKVLVRAGVPMEDASSKAVQGIGWLLRLSMLALIALVCTKVGISIPWDKVIAVFK